MQYIFVDESRINPTNRYQLFGSIWFPRELQEKIRSQFWQLWDKSFETRKSELKWTKVSKSKLSVYKKFVDLFYSFPKTDFRYVVLDRHAIDYKKFHDSNEELGFYKFLYFFLSRNIQKDRQYKEIEDVYQIFMDHRREDEVGKLSDLKDFINLYFGHRSDSSVVRNIESVPDSHDSPEIQLIDILLGATGYCWEGFETSPVKLDLIHHICKVFGVGSLNKPTQYLTYKFNIWEFKLIKNV